MERGGSRTAGAALLALLFCAGNALAVTCTSTAAGGNWNVTGTWTGCAGGNGAPANTPGTNDTAIIATTGGNAVTVNVASSVVAVTVNATAILTQSSSLTTSGALSVSGTLNSTNTMAIGGTTTVAGTLNITAVTGTHTFTGAVGITGTWNVTVAEPVTMGNNLTNNGTFTSGTGAYTFSGASTWGGASPVTFSGNVNVNAAVANNNTVTVTGTLAIANGITFTNNATVTASGNITGGNAASTWTNAANSTLNAAGAVLATGTLNASASSNTVNYNGAGAQAIKTPSANDYFHLSLSTGGTKTPAAGTLDILGNLSIGAGTTYGGTNNPAVNLTGNFANSGTFTSGTGVFTFNSTTAVQNISGTPTFASLTINNTGGGIVASTDVTVSTTLTLTAGIVNAGANTIILSNTAAAALAGGSATSYVIGCLRKTFAGGGTLNFRAAGLDEFPVGIAGSYLPVEFTAGTTSTAGTLTVCPVGTDHPSMSLANGGQIDTTKSLNRYWSMASVTMNTTAVLANAIFKFPNGATEYDAGATPGNFIVERWNGAVWNPTTLVVAGATSTQAQNIDLTGATSQFAIGEPFPGFNGSPGAFNIFETSTPAGTVIGRLFTKVVATNFNVAVVAVANNAVNPAPSTNTLTINVVDATGTPGAFSAATNCWSGWPNVGASTVVNSPVAWAAGRLNTVTITAPAVAVRNARIKVVQTGTGATGCSTDNFSIRPTTFAVTSTNATNTDSINTPVFAAGASFNLTATALAGYDGTPTIDNTKVIGTPNPGSIGGSFSAAPVGSGAASGSTFTYSEVGNFGLNANAVFDSTFTSVDPSNDCTPDFSNGLVGGKYGCSFGSALVPQVTAPPGLGGGKGFGRFIPHHFALVAGSTLTNRAALVCASTFTYMNEGLALAFTVQAQNSANTVTQNYAGAYAKLSPTTFGSWNVGARSGTTNLTTRVDSGLAPTGSWSNGIVNVSMTTGILRAGPPPPATPDNPDGPFASTSFGIAPGDSDGVVLGAFDLDVDNNTVNEHARVGPVTELRFGRLRLQNAVGSEKLALPVPIQTEYWAAAGFVTNTLDSCTSIPRSAIILGTYTGSLTPAPNCLTFVQQNPVLFASGVGTLSLAAPTGAVGGSVLLTPNLGAATTGSFCSAAGVAPTSPATAAGLSYLLGRWDDTSNPDANANTNYDDKPASRAAFGLYGGQPNNFIFLRENY